MPDPVARLLSELATDEGRQRENWAISGAAA
jgi:hypothetical protein